MKLLGRIIILLALIGCGVAIYVQESRKDLSLSSVATANSRPRTTEPSSLGSTQRAPNHTSNLNNEFAMAARRSADKLAARWHGLYREIVDLACAQTATAPSAASARRLAILRQGDHLLAGGHFAQAADFLTKACEAYPDDVDALECLAVALVAAQRFDDSLAVYQRLLKLDADNPTTMFNYALALSRLHRLPEAQKAYRTLLSGHENFLQARYNLAAVYEANGELAHAGEQWKKVIELQPGLAYPHAKYGELLLDQGEAQEAMGELGQAAKLNPDDPSAWLNYSAAAQAAGSLGLAIVAANKAAKLAPAGAADMARLGCLYIELYEHTGRDNLRTQALDAWRQSIKLDPDQDMVPKMIRQYDKPAPSQP
jgi:tetratricopeptide (TPR) repeat protein